MDDSYALSFEYAEIAEEIIKEKRKDILALGISIGFITSNKEKKHGRTKLVLGECQKVSDLQRVFCPYDFLIIIYEVNCIGLSNDQMKILIWHELEHIGVDPKNGEFYVKPHDVEEFDDIINAHGIHWQE